MFGSIKHPPERREQKTNTESLQTAGIILDRWILYALWEMWHFILKVDCRLWLKEKKNHSLKAVYNKQFPFISWIRSDAEEMIPD